jgi:predicted dehydrogenase
MQKPMPRIGFIGCGAIARRHAQNLKDRARLYFSSRSRASAEAFQKEFGGSVCATWEAMVALPEIEAVIICSPPQFHLPQILAALDAGKAVLVEKPMCITPEEVTAVEQALTACEHPLLMVAENYYYKPSLKLTKEAIAAGYLGTIQTAHLQKRFTQQTAGWKNEYGALLEGGIHFVALISDLFETPPQTIQAAFPNHSPGQPERHTQLNLGYAGDVRVTLEYAWNIPSLTKGLFQHCHIIGEHGRIVFESNGIYLRLASRQRRRLHFPVKDLMGYGAMTDDFLACLENRERQPYSDFAKAKRDLQIIFEAYAQLP